MAVGMNGGKWASIPPPPSSSFATPLLSSVHQLFFTSATTNPTSRRRRRRRLCRQCKLTSSSLHLPLLPFPSDEVLVPSETKTLHLYEARFLALLEESSLQKKNLFVHFVLDPIVRERSSYEASFAARYGCLVIIDNVQRLDIGALVSIRGVGRVNIVNLVQLDPYLRGVVVPMHDAEPECMKTLDSTVSELKDALFNLQMLQIKLKTHKDELLQTRLTNCLRWAEKEPLLDCDEAFVPSLAERISFSALQPVTGFTSSEMLNLQKEKLRAMDLLDTIERLTGSMRLVKENTAMVAAKLAIQSLET